MRIVAMLMIVAHHYAIHGIQSNLQAYHAGDFFHRVFVNILLPGGQIGVALFFMISGYFMVCKDTVSLSKILLQAWFYSVFNFALYGILRLSGALPAALSASFFLYFKRVLLPISASDNWFVTVYAYLMLISPVLNMFCRKLNKGGFLAVMVFAWIFWYAGSFFGAGYNALFRGIFFYGIGAFMRLHTEKWRARPALAAGFALCWLAGSAAFYVTQSPLFEQPPATFIENLLREGVDLSNALVVAPLCAIFLFKIFESLDISSERINAVAAATFGVYLLHDNSIGRELFWHVLFKVDTVQYSARFFPLYALMTIACVFAVCAAIDFARISLFERPVLPKFKSLVANIKERITI